MTVADLRAEATAIWDIRSVAALLVWDQQTALPAPAHTVRSRQLAWAERALHERYRSRTLGRLLDGAGDGALVRVMRHEREKAERVPPELREQLSEAAGLAQRAWVRAREHRRYAEFMPYLARNVELRRRYADCFGDLDDPYDAHLDDYDPHARTREVAAVLGELKRRLLGLAEAARTRRPAEPLHGPFAVERQRAFAGELLARIGLERDRARVVESPHPLTVAMGVDDVGVTTRYSSENLDGVFLCLHELGHALYEQGFEREIAHTPLAQGASASMHEAQARLFENLVGRSRPFWRFALPRLQAAFPLQLGELGVEEIDAVLNGVRNSAIRLRADELTYNLHIILRFELERELLDGTLAPEDLPDAWAARCREYLGVEVSDDAAGVLQDVQWAFGAFGYFPTYALGNVIAVQLWEALRRDVPDLDDELAAGRFDSLLAWLGEHVWRHGRRYPAAELLERAVGTGIDVEPYTAYLVEKFSVAATP
jgi:carboxypeptidase Taq